MRNKILDAGLKVYPNVTITNVAKHMGVTIPAVFYYFRGDEIKDAVEEYAIQIDDKQVIAQMITSKVPRVDSWDYKTKISYLVDTV